LTPLPFDAGASGGLGGGSCAAKEGKPSYFAHTGSYSISPDGEPAGEGVGALPGRVVYLVPTVITVKSTAGEIAKGEALGVRGLRESFGRQAFANCSSILNRVSTILVK